MQNTIIVIVFLSTLIGNFAINHASFNGGNAVKYYPVHVTLEIMYGKSGLVAYLEFKNISKNTIFLDKYTIGLSDEPISRVFTIHDKNGKLLDYKGMLVKRKLSKDDFIEIHSDGLIKTSTVLNRWYEFPKGDHEYSISYNAINHSYEQQNMFEIVSNKVVVSYKN